MDFPREIYAIQHNETKRIYIGSSKNVGSRYSAHIGKLRAGKHPVEDMQKDFDEYGENYSLFILEKITEYKDRIKEYEWMKKYNTTERGVGYNYKDKANIMNFVKNFPPYVEGLPKETNIVTKKDLHKMVDGLTEYETLYAYTLLSGLFKGR